MQKKKKKNEKNIIKTGQETTSNKRWEKEGELGANAQSICIKPIDIFDYIYNT